MNDVAVGFGPDLAESPLRTCSRAVAQNNRSPAGEQKAVTTGEGNRLRNPFHTQPAVAARKHGEVRQICGGIVFAGRRAFFFGPILLYQPPRGCSFEPVLTESGDVHRCEDVSYRVQATSLFWTNRQNLRTPEQFASIARELYSSVLNAVDQPKGVIMGKLEGKVAVITGGNSGIGLATAKRFVEEGAHVVITGRREKELKEAAAFIGRNVTTVTGDVTRLQDLDRLYAVVKEKHGRIDVLFVNAGWGEVAPLEAATEAHFDKTFDLNVKGLFFTAQKALPLFKDGGSIILNSSVANVLGVPAFTVYAASKAAVRSFARGWTMELKDRKIRVNTVSPGPIETPAPETTTGLTAEQAKQAV